MINRQPYAHTIHICHTPWFEPVSIGEQTQWLTVWPHGGPYMVFFDNNSPRLTFTVCFIIKLSIILHIMGWFHHCLDSEKCVFCYVTAMHITLSNRLRFPKYIPLIPVLDNVIQSCKLCWKFQSLYACLSLLIEKECVHR